MKVERYRNSESGENDQLGISEFVSQRISHFKKYFLANTEGVEYARIIKEAPDGGKFIFSYSETSKSISIGGSSETLHIEVAYPREDWKQIYTLRGANPELGTEGVISYTNTFPGNRNLPPANSPETMRELLNMEMYLMPIDTSVSESQLILQDGYMDPA